MFEEFVEVVVAVADGAAFDDDDEEAFDVLVAEFAFAIAADAAAADP